MEYSGIILTLAGMLAGGLIYTIRQEGKLNLLRKDLGHAKEYIDHLIDEGKNFKLVQGGYENTQNGMKVTIARIEEKQDATIEKIVELKELLKSQR